MKFLHTEKYRKKERKKERKRERNRENKKGQTKSIDKKNDNMGNEECRGIIPHEKNVKINNIERKTASSSSRRNLIVNAMLCYAMFCSEYVWLRVTD